MIAFGRQVCGDLDAGAAHEWLVTDGLGGYAMGRVAGLRTRRYHGLLIVAAPGASARRLGLAALDPLVRIGDRIVRLATDEWVGGAVDPAGQVDHAVGLSQRRRPPRQEQADRHGPAIRPPPDEAKHVWHPGPDPDPDVVRRGRSARRSQGAVVLPVEEDTARLVRGPDFTDDRDRLLERLDGLAGGAARPAHRLDRVPCPTGSDPQLETTAGEQVDRCGGAGQHDRRPQREVQHVVAEPNPRGARRHVREQGPRVEEARLVRVVLERHHVEAGPVRDHRQLDGVMRSLRRRRDERPEEQLVSVVHGDPSVLVRVRGDVHSATTWICAVEVVSRDRAPVQRHACHGSPQR